MKGKYATSGATLIVVVLITLLLMAVVLAATMRLGLASRQNSGDQKAILNAQYKAESQVALLKSRLTDFQQILSPTIPGSGGAVINHMIVPSTMTKDTLRALAENYCNKLNSPTAWNAISDYGAARNDLDDQIYPAAMQCVVDSSVSNPDQYSVMSAVVQPVAYQVLPSGERPSDTSDATIVKQWWSNKLNTLQTFDNSKFKLQAIKVDRLSEQRYRFFLGLNSASARGVDGSTSRVVNTKRAQNGTWWFEIVLPSLLDDVLMTNHHRARPSNLTSSNYDPLGAPGVNFTSQRFDGSIHTNEKLLFDPSSSAQFLDKVSSVGCTNLPISGQPSGGNCQSTAGVYIGQDSSVSIPPDSENTDQARDRWIADLIASSPRTVSFVKEATDAAQINYDKTDFTAAYKPLPDNANDQVQDANTAGLNFGDDQVELTLKAAAADGTLPATYANSKWGSPDPTYQYITANRTRTTSTQSCSYSSWSYADNYSWSLGSYIPTSTWNNTSDPNLKSTKIERIWGKDYTRYILRTKTCTTQNTTQTVTEEYRYGSDKKLYLKPSTGDWDSATLVRDNFNGVIYGNDISSVVGPGRTGTTGELSTVKPALASFAGLTVASNNDVTINSDLAMTETPCTFTEAKATPPCVRRPRNVLGIYSQTGDIIIGANTGNNLNVHAALLASTGQVQVAGYNTRSQSGNVNLIGSLIENWYGAFGTYGSYGNTGYGRNFTYDIRLREGITPPSFPVSPRWNVVPASDLSDGRLTSIIWRQGTTGDY